MFGLAEAVELRSRSVAMKEMGRPHCQIGLGQADLLRFGADLAAGGYK